MKKFIVQVKEVHILSVEVTANNPDEAKNIAEDMLANGEADMDYLEYSHTLPKADWIVE